MTGVEIATISKRLYALEQPKAEQRQREAGKVAGRSRPKKAQETVSEAIDQPITGKALDHVAAAVQVSAPSLRKAIRVADAIESDPEKYAAAKEPLEKRQWSKAARVVEEIDGAKTPPAATPAKAKPFDQERTILCVLGAIRDAARAWPPEAPVDAFIQMLEIEVGRLKRRRERTA